MNNIEFVETTRDFFYTLTPEQRDKFISIIGYLNYRKVKRDFKTYNDIQNQKKEIYTTYLRSLKDDK